MKISDVNGTNASPYVQQVNASDRNQSPEAIANRQASADKVEISTESKEMKKAYDRIETAPDLRAERISEIKRLIAEDKYTVDAEAVAEKMLKRSILDLI
jgi:negative regulator of flagellin synthesis FlgM